MRPDDITEVVEVAIIENETVIGLAQEQRRISRKNFLIRELNRIAKLEAIDVRQIGSTDESGV